MRSIIARDLPFTHQDVPVNEAITWAKENNQPYKIELLNDLKRSGTTIAKDLAGQELGSASDDESKVDTISLYSQGDYTDLCRGGHVESTGKVGAFKLMRVAGAYWRGNENNPQMRRLCRPVRMRVSYFCQVPPLLRDLPVPLQVRRTQNLPPRYRIFLSGFS